MWMCMYMHMSHVCHSHFNKSKHRPDPTLEFPLTLEGYSIIWPISYTHSLKADVQMFTHTISITVQCFCIVFYYCCHKLYPPTPITALILFLPACQPSCSTCENDFECTACGGSFLLSGRQCVTTCERGLFQDHTRCLSKSTAVYISFTFILLTFCDAVYICCTFMMLSYQR